MGLATLGGIPFRTGPEEIRWDFKIKVSDRKALAGKVIQVLGTDLGDMTVTGSFGRGDRKQGDSGGWEEQLRFRDQVKAWTRGAEAQRSPTPLRFTYPPRGWDFQVYIKGYSAPAGATVRLANNEINPKWTLTLFVVDDTSRKVVRGIRDLYIKRLMEGIGWKQTDYNGPSQAYLDDLLSGRSTGQYLADKAQEAFDQGGLPLGGSGQ